MGPVTYVVTWLVLVALAAASLGFSFLALGPLAAPVALTIAGVKAVLVASVFMHLAEEPFVERLVLGLAVGLLLLLVLLVVGDVVGR